MRIFLVLLAAWGVAGSTWAAPLRVVSFNVENSLGGTTNTAKLTRVAERLERIGADVVTLQELFTSDTGPCSQLANRLGLPYQVNSFSLLKTHNQAIFSRYPISQAVNVFGTGMVRPILLAKIDVPNLTDDPWVAVAHLKSGTSVSDQFNRSVELARLKNALRERGVTSQSPVILAGDFNMRSTVASTTFFQDPDGSLGYGNITDPIFPLTGSQNTDHHFPATETDGTSGLNILKLDLRQAGTGGSSSTHTLGALDHIMVSEPIRNRQPSSEIYHVTNDAAGVGGLAKFGDPPATATTYTSDHLPIFADLLLRDDGDGFADDAIPPALGWNVSSNTLTFVNRPVTSGATDVTAIDDEDPAPVVTVYPLNPTYTNAGTRKITYMARDRMGNLQTVDRTVTVAGWGQGGVTHNLQWPPAMQIPVNGQGTVYAQINIPGWTETVAKVAPNVRCWIGVHTQNTDPATWPGIAWKEASLNGAQGFGTGADEYMLSLQASETGPGIFYFAARWQINGGAYGYGGVASGGGGGAWDGTVNTAGVLTVGSTVGTWSSNAPVTSELVGKYAIGGAASVSGAAESPVMEAQANSLSLTAMVRKDDPKLAVGAEWVTDLAAGWSTNGVSSTTNGLAQPADPGLERRKYVIPYDPANEPRKFLRLKATLAQ